MQLARAIDRLNYRTHRQPHQPVKLDRSNRLATGVFSAYIFANGNKFMHDLVSNRSTALGASNVSSFDSLVGRVVTTDGFASSDIRRPNIGLNGRPNFSMITIFSYASGTYCVSVPDAVAGNNGFDIRNDGTGMRAGLKGGANPWVQTTAVAVTANRFTMWGFSYDGATGRFYKDGVQQVTLSTTGAVDTTDDELDIGVLGTFGARATIKIALVVFTARVWSASDMRSLFLNPYQLFTRLNRSEGFNLALVAPPPPSPPAGHRAIRGAITGQVPIHQLQL